MRLCQILFFCFLSSLCVSQSITGAELLDRAINYHDPNGNWPTFQGDLRVTMNTPGKSDRVTDFNINLPAESFEITSVRDSITIYQMINSEGCQYTLNSETDISDEDKKTHRLNCDRTQMWRDYYTYLYGLPMKLKDPGTIIDPVVSEREFKGKTYKVLKVNYDQAVGVDTWYFYFDPITYKMEVYQFFKVEENNDGEYILLTGEETISGVKMPKTRAWYYNKADKYLGTDVLGL